MKQTKRGTSKTHCLGLENKFDMSLAKGKIAFYCCGFLAIALFLFALNVMSLLLATGPRYPVSVFFGYFKTPLLLLLNYLPIAAIFVFFFCVVGSVWKSYALTGAVTLGFTVANFYLLKFRDDPLMFSDVLYLREAVQISEAGYDYTPSLLMMAVLLVFAALTVLMKVLCEIKVNFTCRFYGVIVAIVLCLVLKDIYFSGNVYDKYTRNNNNINEWSSTQVYVSKGFVYPFVHSISDMIEVKPDGYDEDYAKKILDSYDDKKIPDDKKVNIVAVMMEAYCDLEKMGVENIEDSAYNMYRYLKNTGYSGTLVTNIFAGGTIDTERAFVSGLSSMEHVRRNTNSYAYYLTGNGYYAEGSHPGENWFYNRMNVNKHLGFNNYRFAEDYYSQKYGDEMRYDYKVIDDIHAQYLTFLQYNENKPYFGFHVTYQGHGPYRTDKREWGTDKNPLYVNDDLSIEAQNIINNYLGSVYITGEQLGYLYNRLLDFEEPTVIVLFGDHKPWLGDGNSVYDELDINIDVSTKEGFLNYYSTEYVILANDSAKKMLGNDFKGKGPTIGSQFLMNEVFSLIGIEGDAYMQYTNDVRQTIAAVNDVALLTNDGELYPLDNLPKDLQRLYDEYKWVEYYHRTTFKY